MSNIPTAAPVKGQSKSNVWLIVIIILVVGAILWPLLKKNPPAETGTLEDGLATSTVSLDETVGEPTDLAVINNSSVNQTAAVVNSGVGNMILRAYFGNRRLDPPGLKCDAVYPVFRTVPETTAVGRAALAELLKGPSPSEAAAGVVTAINPGVKLQSLTIDQGAARADFSSELGAEVGGACLVTTIRAQITETLKQFPTIKSVLISINGVSAGILQP
ncbi:MAG: GerMN domain-containing protein [Candidatus Vogelbacteria bacterium]|nr:GerMN domain-containing protein [Candidatus Vogelbacteria bacterium]